MSQSVTFLHSSDLQIGMARWFLSEEAQARFDDDRIRAISKIGEVAVAHGCAFIVLAGDIFEHNSLHPRTIGRALEALRSLPVPAFLLAGNHDPLTADSVFYKMADLDGITVFKDSAIHEVFPGIEVVGAPLLNKIATVDVVRAAIEPLAPSPHVRVLVGHGQVESRGSDHRADLIDLDYVESKLSDGTIDYLALGDTHSVQAVGSSGRVWYSGAPETTDFHDLNPELAGGETNSGNVLVVTVSKEDIDVQQISIGTWTFESLTRDLTSDEDISEFLSHLASYPDKSRTVVKYGLRGVVSLQQYQVLESGIAELEDVFASLKPRERTTDLVIEPTIAEIENLNVSGYAAQALTELVHNISTDAGSEVDRDSLNLLFRLSRGN